MKKVLCCTALVLAFCFVLSGCIPGIMVIPDSSDIGEPKVFEKDGIKLTLTDRFTEQKSELGFYGYYVTNFCGVVVLKEEFSLEEGLADSSLETYVSNVIRNNGHTDVTPQNRDGLWFYVSDTDTTRRYSFSFKGSDAFYIVQYLCAIPDAPALEDLIFLWAGCVEVE